MRFDKETLEKLCAKSDDELWKDIRGIAKIAKISLPENSPSHEELEKLRALLTGSGQISAEEAKKAVEAYRARNGK